MAASDDSWLTVDGQMTHPQAPAGSGGAGPSVQLGPFGHGASAFAVALPHPQAPAARLLASFASGPGARSVLGRNFRRHHHRLAVPVHTPLDPGMGWPLIHTKVTYEIASNVPKPLHDAIRQGVRHWDRALKAAGIRLHYFYSDKPVSAPDHNVHTFELDELFLYQPDAKGELRATLLPGRKPPVSHAFTEFPDSSVAHQTIKTAFHRGGLLTRVEGKEHAGMVPYVDCDHTYMLGVVVHEIGHAMGLDHWEKGSRPAKTSTVMAGPEIGDRTSPSSTDMATLISRAQRERRMLYFPR